MRHAKLLHRVGYLAVVAAICHAATVRAADMARCMPTDTAVYIGWAQLVDEASSDLRTEKQLLEAMAQWMHAQGDSSESALTSTLLDAIVPLETGSVGIGLFDITLSDEIPDIQVALVVDAGQGSARLVEVVRELLAYASDPEQIVWRTVNGAKLQCAPLGDSPLKLLWGLCEGRFVLALGETAAGKVVDCIHGTTETLADVAELKMGRAKTKARTDARHFCLYADVARIMSRGKEIVQQMNAPLPPIVDQVIDELGISSLKSKYAHYDEAGGQPRMMGFARVEGPRRGLLKLWDQRPLTDDDLKIIPQDAYWAEVANLDLTGLWAETMRIIGVLAPDTLPEIDGALAQGEQVLGFSINEELLPAFGDTWALFDAPDHGGILLSGTVLVAEVKDTASLHRVLTRVTQSIANFLMEEDVNLRLAETTYGDHTIHYVLVGGAPVPVAPSWGFTGDRWVFGLFPQTVATAMKQVDPKTRHGSLLDNPDFKAARAKLPTTVQSVAYFDTRYFSRMFYPFINALQTMGVSMFGAHGAVLDLAVMPPLADRVADTTNYVGVCTMDDDGILYASIGDGSEITMMTVGAAAMGTSILLPSLASARHQAKRTVSMSHLRGISQACMVYAVDHNDRLPASFDELIDEHLITRKMLNSPLDPEGTVSYILITRTEPLSREREAYKNILAYERVRNDEGTNAVFADGHVEYVSMFRFTQLLRSTYRNLGRENEIPAQFRNTPTAPQEIR